MQFQHFKTMVADYLQRDKTTLFDDGAVLPVVDKISAAVNMAKDDAQLARKFEVARLRADLTINKTTGGNLSSMVLTGTATPVAVRSVERAFVPTVQSPTVNYPVDIISRDEQVNRVKYQVERFIPEDRTDGTLPNPYVNFAVIQEAETLYLYPWSDSLFGATSITASFDIVKWFPDYSSDTDEDFFLLRGRNWLLFKTISYLNMFLKDDQRTLVTEKMLSDAWKTLVAYDEAQVNTSAPINLD